MMSSTVDTDASPDTPEAGDREEQLRNIIMTTRDLPAMPHVASKVLALCSEPSTSAKQIQKVIADDQAMTARILKIANSAMYACSRNVKTLTEAIVMLGFNSIRSLVVTSAARNLYSSGSKRMGLKERLLWEHSIGCGFACKLLVQERYPNLAEEAFLAGLMHDIGKLVLNLHAPDRFDEIVQIVYNENRAFVETETEILGFDHTQVGALLVGKWKLPALMEDVIGLHHDPSALTPDSHLLLYLDLANNMCKKLGIGFVDNPDLDLAGLPSNQILGLSPEIFATTADKLQATLETEMEIFV
jgi:HD-like signal output (HDOD) protein